MNLLILSINWVFDQMNELGLLFEGMEVDSTALIIIQKLMTFKQDLHMDDFAIMDYFFNLKKIRRFEYRLRKYFDFKLFALNLIYQLINQCEDYLIYLFVDLLVDQLFDKLIDKFVGLLVNKLVDQLIYQLFDKLVYNLVDQSGV